MASIWRALAFLIAGIVFVQGMTVEEFMEERKEVLREENHNFLGSDLELTELETSVNFKIQALKTSELNLAFLEDDLPASQSFFQSKAKIEESKVFKFIQEMPKGGVMHVHEFAITSSDWVIQNITYRDNLYMCINQDSNNLQFGW